MGMVKSRLPNSTRWYGWRPQAPDRRDLRFLPPRKVLENLPPKVDLTPQMGPVLDQGQLGSCGPNSVASLILFDQAEQGLPLDVPSRLQIYWDSRQLMGTLGDDSGVDNRTMLRALNQFGFCSEKLWPYNIDAFRTMLPPVVEAAAAAQKITNYAAVRQDLDIMRGTLAARRPFLYGWTVYESAEGPEATRTGRIPLPSPGEHMVSGHDVVICAYDDSTQEFMFKNSWKGWGLNESGYGFMPYAYATDPNLSSDFWVINAIPGGAEPPPPPPPPLPAPLKVVFNLAFSRSVPKGGRIVFSAPVAIPAGQYDVVPHLKDSVTPAGGEEGEYSVEARDPGQVDGPRGKE